MTNYNDKITIKQLMKIRESNMLTINSEYQRGPVWKESQQKKLIDSVLRGYPLPLIYLHVKKIETMNLKGISNVTEKYEIIDGQQRINSLYQYSQGHFKLFDPEKDDKIARFPKFIKDVPCEWANCFYADLTEELKEKFDSTELAYVRVDTDNEDEARDLFIRLQAGTPLNDQEKRDAWPGGYTEFVLRFAGKRNNIKFPGHDFFNNWVKKASPRNVKDTGLSRKLCAGLGMLYLRHATNGNWIDIKTQNIDEFYHQNLGLEMNDPRVARFNNLLNLALECLNGYTGKKLDDHEVYHIILLLDSLYDDYTKSWVASFQKALDNFRKEFAYAKKFKEGEYFQNYAMLTSSSASSSNSLKTRHNFFTKKMFETLNPILKDKARLYGELEREILYYRYEKKCQICGTDISWNDLEIHHVDQHQHGGKTILENGIPVHKKCHPKGQAALNFNQKMDEYILMDSINETYFTGELLSDKRYSRAPFKWSYNINESKIFKNIKELYSLIIENNFTDIKIISDPFNKKIIHDIEIDIEYENINKIVNGDIITNNILQGIEDTISKLINDGIKKELIKEELFKYLIKEGLTVEIPLDEFGESIISPGTTFLMNDRNSFMFIIKRIEEKINIQLKKLGISDDFQYINYLPKPILKEYNKKTGYYKYSIYIKFGIKN
jgi:hypothetical protein